MLLQIAHPNDVLIGAWSTVDEFADVAGAMDAVQSPSFECYPTLLCRVIDKNGQWHYAGIYAKSSFTSVSRNDCAIDKIVFNSFYKSNLIEVYTSNNSADQIIFSIVQLLSKQRIFETLLACLKHAMKTPSPYNDLCERCIRMLDGFFPKETKTPEYINVKHSVSRTESYRLDACFYICEFLEGDFHRATDAVWSLARASRDNGLGAPTKDHEREMLDIVRREITMYEIALAIAEY